MSEHTTDGCRWGRAGLPACRAGTRGTRYWCAACAPALDPRIDHHPDCYQVTGVTHDMPAGICDCRVLRMLDDQAPVSRVQAIEAAEDRAEQVSYDAWRERS